MFLTKSIHIVLYCLGPNFLYTFNSKWLPVSPPWLPDFKNSRSFLLQKLLKVFLFFLCQFVESVNLLSWLQIDLLEELLKSINRDPTFTLFLFAFILSQKCLIYSISLFLCASLILEFLLHTLLREFLVAFSFSMQFKALN